MSNTELYNLIYQVESAIKDIALVHGHIKKTFKMGNSIIVRFEDGSIYRQELLSKVHTKENIITDENN